MDINKMLAELRHGEGADRRSDHDLGTAGSWSRKASWTSTGMDVANQAARPPSWQQESTEKRTQRLSENSSCLKNLDKSR